jgi:hypothetical protein
MIRANTVLVAQASACGFWSLQGPNVAADQAAEEEIYFVIPNEVRNLSLA